MGKRHILPLIIILILTALGVSYLFFSPVIRPWWRTLTQEGKRILGWGVDRVSPEEKRIREEVILKKMEEANAEQDWRSLAPEYPRLKRFEATSPEEKVKILRESPEFKEIAKEFRDYLRKREELILPDPPFPSQKEAMDLTHLKDKATERIIERLRANGEKTSHEKPLEENLRLGIKGALASRKILERPPPPQVKVKVEAEIEMLIWVLPNGVVDRVIPLMKGDVELERIAIQYLKQWRFAPLSQEKPQVEQSGTILVKFRLQ